MKPKFFKLSRPSILVVSLLLCLSSGHAGTYYWDPNGSGTAGFGTAGGTWGTSAFWGTDPAGSGATANTSITTSDDVYFGTDSVGLAAGTVAGPSGKGFLNMTFGSASGTIILSGGSLYLNSSTGSTITVNNASDTISTQLLGTGSKLIKAGTGTLTLTGTSTYSGTTTINANGGILSFGAGGSARSSSGFTVGSNATLELVGTNIFVSNHSTAVDNSRVITVNGGTLLMKSTSETRIGNVTLHNGATWTSDRTLASYDILLGNTTTGAATVSVTGNAASVMNSSVTGGGIHLQGVQNFDVTDVTSSTAVDLTVSMILGSQGKANGDAGGIRKSGTGTMELTKTNTYTGATVVNEGILKLSGPNEGNSGLYASSGITINNGGQVLVSTTNALHGFSSTAGKVTIDAGGSMTTANGVTAHIRAALELNGGELAGGTPDPTYGGWTLNVGDVTATGTATSTISASQVNWTGTRTFTVSDAAGKLDVTGTFDRPGGTMTGALTKSGAGTMVLSGANTYSGGTTVSGGTLVVNNTTGSGTGTGTVSVSSGATLSGSGTISGATTISGTHAPGNSPGIQTFTSDLTYASGSIFEWDLASSASGTRGTQYDGVNVGGTLSGGTNATFKVVLNSGAFTDTFWDTNQTWADIFKAGVDGSGSALGIASIFTAINGTGITWDSGTSHGNVVGQGYFTMTTTSLNWTAVPEPTSALAGLLITVGLLRRRRAVVAG